MALRENYLETKKEKKFIGKCKEGEDDARYPGFKGGEGGVKLQERGHPYPELLVSKRGATGHLQLNEGAHKKGLCTTGKKVLSPIGGCLFTTPW